MMMRKDLMQSSFLDLKELILSRSELHIKRRPIYRFRALVRQVTNNLHWLVGAEVEIGQNVDKNISNVLKKKATSELFTLEIKSKFRKKTQQRSPSDIEKLYNVLMNFDWFRSYPEKVRKRMPARLQHVYYGPDRFIIREGDPPYAVYYIISGKVSTVQSTSDGKTAPATSKLAREVGPGERFGELALVHDLNRRVTFKTKTHCELLYLKKDDFDVVLKRYLRQQFESLSSSLELFRHYFPSWTKNEQRECCLQSKLETHPPDTVILSHNYGKQTQVYFLVSGVCKMIQRVQIEVYYRNGRKKWREYVPVKRKQPEFISRTMSRPEVGRKEEEDSEMKKTLSFHFSAIKESKDNKLTEIEFHFVDVATISPGGCFGFGEDLNDRYIISSTEVTLFVIPVFWLRANNAYMMLGIAAFFDHYYPPQEEADLSCRNTKTSVGAIFTRTNFVTLKYVTDGWGTEKNGFHLVITAVKDPKHECKDFRCHQKEFCIHPELLCDGISHCADGSDESPAKCSRNDAGSILGISLPMFVIGLISCILIISVLGVVTGLFFCRNRPSMQQNTPSHSQHPLHQVYSGSNGTSQVHIQKTNLVPGTTVISPVTVNWVHPVVRGYLVAWARLYCLAE